MTTHKEGIPTAADGSPLHLNSAYQQGRAAKLGSINRGDAPYPKGDDLKAWQNGYDADDDQSGAAARDKTMDTKPAKAEGQTKTASKSK